jgi:hydrogenase maturation protease
MKKENKQLEDALVFGADKSDSILILGIGNYLMGDEGVGVHLVQEMEKMDLPDYIDVLDGGTGGFFLMNVFDVYGTVIFVDATMDGQPAGTLKTIKPRFASDYPKTLSVHDVGLKDMLEALYLQDNLPDMYLLTVSIESMMPMTVEMSPEVQACLPKAIDTLIQWATQLYEARV